MLFVQSNEISLHRKVKYNYKLVNSRIWLSLVQVALWDQNWWQMMTNVTIT